MQPTEHSRRLERTGAESVLEALSAPSVLAHSLSRDGWTVAGNVPFWKLKWKNPSKSSLSSRLPPQYELHGHLRPRQQAYFSNDRTVADLLCSFVAAQWHGELDFDSLSKRSSEFIGEALAQRIGDMAWILEFAADVPLADGGRPCLAVLYSHFGGGFGAVVGCGSSRDGG